MSSVVVYLAFQGRTMLLTSDSRPDFIMAGLFDAWLLDPERGVDVDLLSLPHYGSTRNVTREFLGQVRADHYVVVGEPRFRLPDPATIEMLASTRGEEVALHVAGTVPEDRAVELRALADRLGMRPAAFRPHDRASMVIDLLDPVAPTLP
jgi:beta-lactamase superfamily II metal-dependent hydrolase